MEKVEVTFKNQDGRQISCDVSLNDDETMDLKADFGEKGLDTNETGFHIALFNLLFTQLLPEDKNE